MADPPRSHADNHQERFGEALRRARQATGLTQEELAARAGVSAKAISALERGERRHPYPSTVRALAAALPLSEGELEHFVSTVPLRGQPVPTASPPPFDPLPYPRTSLVGRAVELTKARELLLENAAPLLTLIGTGGVGKTRLALAVAHQVVAAFPDGVVFVDLAPRRDPNSVLAAIAQALGVRQVADLSLADILVAFLRHRRLLLVLDNFEHLLEAATQVTRLLEHCPALQILATSRAPLRVRGEQLQLVAPLALPEVGHAADLSALATVDAVALFLARGQAVDPGFTLREDNATAVISLCRRLDGLPLALELAAARLRLLSIDVLLELLDARLRVLTEGERDRPPRQRTLRDAIAWSYDLLTHHEQTLFRRLSVFPGGVTRQGVDWVSLGNGGNFPPIPDALDRLAALVDHGLVSREAEPRFRMLETVGEFARESLEEHGESRDAHGMLATWGRDVARRHGIQHLFHVDLERRAQVLTAEHANLLAALEYLAMTEDEAAVELAGRLGMFWTALGHLSLGREKLERAAARIDDAPADFGMNVLLRLGVLTVYQFDLERCSTVIARAEALARRHGTDHYHHFIMHLRSCVALFGGDLVTAVPLASASVALSDRAGDRGLAAHCRFVLARAAVATGDFTMAEAACQQVREQVPEGRYAESGVQLVWGWVATKRGLHGRALHAYVTALTCYLPVQDPVNAQPMLDGIAISLAFLDLAEPAAGFFAIAERQRQETGFSLLPPFEAIDWERELIRTRTALGEATFAAAWSEGNTLTLGAAATLAEELARHVPDQAPPTIRDA